MTSNNLIIKIMFLGLIMLATANCTNQFEFSDDGALTSISTQGADRCRGENGEMQRFAVSEEGEFLLFDEGEGEQASNEESSNEGDGEQASNEESSNEGDGEQVGNEESNREDSAQELATCSSIEERLID